AGPQARAPAARRCNPARAYDVWAEVTQAIDASHVAEAAPFAAACGRAPGELQRQSVRRRVVRGDAPKRRAGGPERAAFAARDGAWQEADGASPLTTRRRYREANRPPGHAAPTPPAVRSEERRVGKEGRRRRTGAQ